MTYVITRSCCNDASCVEVCPVDCIHPAPDEPGFGSAEMLYIHPDECIDCGACQEACPVEAVYPDFELPEHLESYLLVNAAYFDWTGEQPEPEPLPTPGPPVTGQKGPLKVAVVGAGPAGWYVADELAQTRRCDVEVTVIDRLPTPYGLVRYGVAPDHLDTKRITDGFARTAAHRRVTTRYNVEVGRDVTHDELAARHHAVVYTTGASEGRSLGILGESLPGSVAAAEVVGWYNGHPDRASLQVPLDHERAVVIGNGDVALDLARVLLASPEKLATVSDLAPHALEALSAGSIEEVVVVGRRGPEHAAFTGPELQALADLPDVDVVVEPADLDGLPAEADIDERSAETFAAVRKADLLRELAARPTTGARRLVLRFGLTPQQVLGEHTVSGLRLTPTAGGDRVDLEAGLVIRATGYRSAGVEGVPLDERGRIPHESGRVAGAGGTYTAGWAKRGPSGVIGTNRADAAETVRTLLDDYAAGSLADPAEDVEPLDELLAARGVTIVDQSGWAALDSHEKETGKEAGRPRVKVTDRAEQLHIAAAKSAKWVVDHVNVRRPRPA